MENTIESQTIEALDDYLFTIDEYILLFPTTISKAIEHIHNKSRIDNAEIPMWLVEEILRTRFRSMLSSKTEWKTIPEYNGSVISCCLDGVLFQGKAIIEPKIVCVTLDSNNMSKKSILHEWAPYIYTKEPFIGSPAASLGIDCAKDLFLDLCGEAKTKMLFL